MRLRSGVHVCAVLAVMATVRVLGAQQAAAPDPHMKSGEKMEFEVASVRENEGPFVPPSFALSPDDAYSDTDALNADFSLSTYIEFAYKPWLTRDSIMRCTIRCRSG